MDYLILLVMIFAAFAFVSFVVVPFVTRPASLLYRGQAHARVKGILICGITAVVVLFFFNPDHLTELKARFWEAFAFAGFSAIFWMPWYLYAFSRRANTEKEKT